MEYFIVWFVGALLHFLLCKYTKYKNCISNEYVFASCIWPITMGIIGFAKLMYFFDKVDEWIKPGSSQHNPTKC
jgi:hypothetical protein